jgi:hypothetical protein
MLFYKIYTNGSGLTNQIFGLITSIIEAYIKGEKVVIIDGFLNDFSKAKVSPINEIFNIKSINMYLKKTYDIIIVDKNDIRFEIISVKYGIDTYNNIDLTEDFIKRFYKNNILYINKNYSFNDMKGDPYYGKEKKVFLKYKINDNLIDEIYDEYLKKDIIIDFNGSYEFKFGWINNFNDKMFEKILLNLIYNDDFIKKSDSFIKNINLNNKINIIHLRLEEDAIKHWSKMNNMTQNDFRLYIQNKYINIIKTYISQSDENIILTSSMSNDVIDFMKHNNYKYKFANKFFDDREKNAIMDLLVSKYCNNIYIGNFNIKNLNGSTFSYYIGKFVKNDVLKIYIDLDKIINKEETTYIY